MGKKGHPEERDGGGVSKKKRSGSEKRRLRRQKNSTLSKEPSADGAELDPDFQFGASEHEEHGDGSEAVGEEVSQVQSPQELSPSIEGTSYTRQDSTTSSKSSKKAQRRKEKKKQAKLEKKKAMLESPENGLDTTSSLAANGIEAQAEALRNDSAAAEGDMSTVSATTNALTDGDDFIPFNFDECEGEEEAEAVSETEQPTAFAKVAAKLGKFVQESNDPTKRKRQGGDDKRSAKRKREMAKADPYPWLQGVSYAQEREPARILHREMLDFVNFVGPTEEEHRVRTFVISRIQKLVERKWPTASLHVFGSFETKLYLPTSDIDLVVLSADGGEVYEKPNHLRRLANWLVKAHIAENIQVITSARVPIIKFIDSVTKLNVDISFNKPSGLVAAGVVKRYTEKMPALRPLVVFIKHFLNMRGMNEVYLGGLGSYSIICMVISFLQRHPKVASGQVRQEDNLGVLVVEFFELYGKRFSYDNVGINIEGDGRYFSKVEYGWQRPGQSYLLSIEDPTDPENDIAKSSFGILKVKSTFGGGHDFLVQRLYDVNDRIKDRKRADVGLDSILSAVVSIDEDMKLGREFIASCFESDIVQEELQRMEESEGEIHEVPSFEPTLLAKTKSSKASSTAPSYVEEDESEDDTLLDNDGHKFVRPDGYKKPSNPADVDDLYSKLNAAPVHPVANAKPQSNAGGRTEDEIYLIQSSDDERHKSRGPSNKDVINLDSDEEVQDSKVAQVDKSARARYWEAKGKENPALIDDYDSASDHLE
ncbi:Poly(A) RNA polymerase cid14 [Taphrina deformans PYCC 5710]|uniref:polynucleotide adenylyltransferase n=1 Tax=Taphrina deformans (strain PYCC 5710 / ATCC 11124 / CBS 356.35 / IMI 108563 / JCM 9778 / NBRC 8474) TaxID=1097556 RepID=R4XBN6_TAPDE|nr:Poly(A) RNA polymerase cid14 [Taphrina deformans PYCC 5710]|eukprot:CCG80748.1 Poly(A) RNA polymerase cid14 [Taphrina deformans PYCC 5710]